MYARPKGAFSDLKTIMVYYQLKYKIDFFVKAPTFKSELYFRGKLVDLFLVLEKS